MIKILITYKKQFTENIVYLNFVIYNKRVCSFKKQVNSLEYIKYKYFDNLLHYIKQFHVKQNYIFAK